MSCDVTRPQTELVEVYMERELKERQPDFEMDKFMKSLEYVMFDY